ncbi:MAG TPA: cytochrome c biogenesis protein CcdA [Candidatus Binatia bacterium]|nr:cytochrome c biogenesis protein CcdA [Candidatus Binatia bacterium]
MEVYLGAFLAGIGATVTPCVLPLYPAFLAYLTRTAPVASPVDGRGGAGTVRLPAGLAALLVWAGVVTGMLAIGGFIAAVAVPMGDFNRIVLPVADLLLIGLGVLLLIGINPFARLPQPSPTAFGRRGPMVGAFSYGLLFAPIAIPCSGPFLVGIFAFSLTIGDAIGRLLFFGVFGIGFGLPLFVLGTVGQARGAQLARAVVRYERPLQLVLGLALVAVGIWDLASNLPLILA